MNFTTDYSLEVNGVIRKALCKHENIIDVAPADGVYEMCADCKEPVFVEDRKERIL